jgi:hypothetical protein
MLAAAQPAPPAQSGLKASTPLNTASGLGAAVMDDAGSKSPLFLHKEQVTISAKDVPGKSIPLNIIGDQKDADFTSGKTWGRLVRLAIGAPWTNFYDIGIDKAGNLFINSKGSSATQHVLTITPAGDVIIQGNLTVNGKVTSK